MKRMIVTFDLDELPESLPRIDALLAAMDAQGLRPSVDDRDETLALPLNTFLGEFNDEVGAAQLGDRVREALGHSGFAVGSLFAASLGDDVACSGEVLTEVEVARADPLMN